MSSFKLGQRPALDGLRAAAVFAVLLNHTGYKFARGFFIGVDVFFVLSGFLITALIIEAIDDRSWSLGDFYIRRALRLLPALFATVLVTDLYVVVASSPVRKSTLETTIPALFYFANWVRSFGATGGGLAHTWSLAIEEQFYLVWPLLLVFIRRRWGDRGLLVGIALGSAIAVTETAARQLLGISTNALYNGLDSHGAIMLLSGCGLAVILERFPMTIDTIRIWSHRLVLPSAAVLIGIGLRTNTDSAFYYLGGFALISAAAAIVVASSVLNSSVMLTWRPLRAIGRISYGLYLWHFVVFVVVDEQTTYRGFSAVPPKFALSFLVATGSYLLLERPFLKLKSRFSPHPDHSHGLVS